MSRVRFLQPAPPKPAHWGSAPVKGVTEVEQEFCTGDAASAYVAISRAREGAAIYIDSRAKLPEVLGLCDCPQVGAIDETLAKAKDAAIVISASVRGGEMLIALGPF